MSSYFIATASSSARMVLQRAAPLLYAAPLLLLLGGCSALTWSGPLVDKALTCAGGEYRGSLGRKPSAAACLAAAEAVVPADLNYAVWRDQSCYVCAITTRGDPSAWVYNKVVGAVSFAATGTLAPTPAPAPDLHNPCLDGAGAQASRKWCDAAAPIDERVADMVSRMNVSEKISNLGNSAGAIGSLDLPHYNWWSEATHGLATGGLGVRNSAQAPHQTNFPFPITTAMSFNRTLWRATGAQIGTEARAFMNLGAAYSTYWAPVINLAREPRWGRNIECPGEDPFLTSEYAVQFVQGFERNPADPAHIQASACCKHFAANSMEHATEAGQTHTRHDFSANITQQDLVDSYLAPFQACVERGRVSGLMCSYNAVNGVPACANDWLLKDVAREAWGFDGYVTSDCGAVSDAFNKHHFTGTPEATAAAALRAGTDNDCGAFYKQHVPAALNQSLISIADVDAALARLFKVRMRLGHFDPPSPLASIAPAAICADATVAGARDAVTQSVALVKNAMDADDAVAAGVSSGSPMPSRLLPRLPLRADGTARSVAVIGPAAVQPASLLSYYGPTGNCGGKMYTMVDAVRAHRAGDATRYVAGLNTTLGDAVPAQLAAAAAAAAAADVTVLCLGTDLSAAREERDAQNITIPAGQVALLAAVAAAAPAPIIVVVFTATPLDLSALLADPKVGAIVHAGQPSVQTLGIGDVLFGAKVPAGRLVQTVYPAAYADEVSIFDFNMRPGPSLFPRPDCAAPYTDCKMGTNPGRTHRFYTGDAVLPFGFGLSYTSFAYSFAAAPPTAVSLAPLAPLLAKARHGFVRAADELAAGGHAAAFIVNVTNTGTLDADDAVLGFLTPPGAGQGGVPLQSLFGFERVHVKAGATVTVYLYPALTEFAQVGLDGTRAALPGRYTVRFGEARSAKQGQQGFLEHSFEAV